MWTWAVPLLSCRSCIAHCEVLLKSPAVWARLRGDWCCSCQLDFCLLQLATTRHVHLWDLSCWQQHLIPWQFKSQLKPHILMLISSSPVAASSWSERASAGLRSQCKVALQCHQRYSWTAAGADGVKWSAVGTVTSCPWRLDTNTLYKSGGKKNKNKKKVLVWNLLKPRGVHEGM